MTSSVGGLNLTRVSDGSRALFIQLTLFATLLVTYFSFTLLYDGFRLEAHEAQVETGVCVGYLLVNSLDACLVAGGSLAGAASISFAQY